MVTRMRSWQAPSRTSFARNTCRAPRGTSSRSPARTSGLVTSTAREIERIPAAWTRAASHRGVGAAGSKPVTVRAANTGQPALGRRLNLGVVVADCGRADQHGCVAKVVGTLPDHHRDSGLAQPFGDIAFGAIAALHLVAQVMHHFSDAGHADAANTDEVDRPDLGAHRLHAGDPTGAK